MSTDDRSPFPSFGLVLGAGGDACAGLLGVTIEGRYTLEERLGEGGFGCVFKARQKSPSRFVAVKVQKHAGHESHRMAKEADLLASLDDPGIARVYEAGEWASPTGSRIFVAMELIADGKPLHRYCADKKLSVRERLTLFREVCRAVSIAHQSGIVHRDLKPSNILVDLRGQPRIIDFGISKLLGTGPDQPSPGKTAFANRGTDDTRSRDFLGTIGYAAPEQLDGKASPCSDVHALGTILQKDLFADCDTVRPPWIQALVARCTAVNPDARPADAGAVMAELDVLIRTGSRRRVRLLTGAAVVTLLLVVMGWLIDRPPQPPKRLAVCVQEEPGSAAGDPVTGRLSTVVGNGVVLSTATNSFVSEIRLNSSLSRGARHLAFGGTSSILAASDVRGWIAWDISQVSRSTWPILEIPSATSVPSNGGAIAVSCDGSTLFAQDDHRIVVAYRTRTGRQLGRLTADGADGATRITALAATADPDTVFIGLSDGSVRRWRLTSVISEPLGKPHVAGPVLLAADASGTRVASCEADGRLMLRDGRTADMVCQASAGLAGAATAVCFVGDDVLVAARRAGASGSAVVRYSPSFMSRLVLSGSASVDVAVTGLTSTGTNVIAIVDSSNAAALTAAARRP